ncbi:hypothetical protein FACS189421_08200 [Bacteroidia bacterium]|nr:hypothetical protein FACS189421_08200 [Bacteroidia bacterium]
MDILLRTQQLATAFSFEKTVKLEDSRMEIHPFRFESSFHELKDRKEDVLCENKAFNYFVFSPSGKETNGQAILLLHGLNERSWKKYLVWAEYLAQTTRKPVILFPLALHMNRTPESWMNPQLARPWADQRNREIPGLENATFMNVALSSRLSQNPLRFYTSGLETVYNLIQLVTEIKNGNHPLFKENTDIHLFAYSIGALISEVLVLANPDNLFAGSRLFMFCGGAVFNEMNGNARDIMDSVANERLHHYYANDFLDNPPTVDSHIADTVKKAFRALIRTDVLRDYRETFFRQASDRIRVLSLKADTVIPTQGTVASLGNASGKITEELDFQYPYSHQLPFPLSTHSNTSKELINESFEAVFSRAACFLGFQTAS